MPAAYLSLSIGLFILSPSWAQELAFIPSKSTAGPNAGPVGWNLTTQLNWIFTAWIFRNFCFVDVNFLRVDFVHVDVSQIDFFQVTFLLADFLQVGLFWIVFLQVDFLLAAFFNKLTFYYIVDFFANWLFGMLTLYPWSAREVFRVLNKSIEPNVYWTAWARYFYLRLLILF